MKDLLGNPYFEGAYIAYPSRDGSNMMLNIGRIARVDESGVYVQHITNGFTLPKLGRAQKLVRTDRAVIVPATYLPADMLQL